MSDILGASELRPPRPVLRRPCGCLPCCSARVGPCGTVWRSRNMTDRLSADDWASTLDDLRDRRVAGRSMGGEERLTKHRAAGKLDARARVDHLLDPGSFQELGTLVGGA